MTITSPKDNAVVNGKAVTHQGQDPGTDDAAGPQRRPTVVRSRARPRPTAPSPEPRHRDRQQHDHHRRAPTRPGNASRVDADRPARHGQADGLAHAPRPTRSSVQAARAGHADGRRSPIPTGKPLAGAAVTFTLSMPGHPDGHAWTRRPARTGKAAFKTTIPKGADGRPGQRHGPGLERSTSGRRRTTRSSRSSSSGRRAAARRVRQRARVAATIRGMPMWRCPHCGTPQAETARCWVCRRSSTACATCRHFRRSVAGQLGYCGLDRQRRPLRGDEIRACWEGGPFSMAPTIPAARARLAVIDGAPVHRRIRRGDRRADRRASPTRATDADRATSAAPEPAPRPPPTSPGWSLWEDPTV